MNFQEILNDLVYGELSQTKIGTNADGQFDDAYYNTMISHLNLGLTDLHRKFNLKTNHIELILNPGRTRYHLHNDHKFSDEQLTVGDFRFDLGNSTLLVDLQANSDPEYIRDQPYARFKEDILVITRVLTPEDRELDLNKVGNPWSVMTPKADVIEFPERLVNQSPGTPEWLLMDRVFVHYRQGHPVIPYGAGEFDGNRVDIDLPYTHKQALIYFMTSRIMNPIGMGQEFNAGNTYYQKYLLECKSLEDTGSYVDQTDDSTKFSSKGFV